MALDLTPAEEAILHLLRGEGGFDFAMTVTRSEGAWVVSLAADSVSMGAADSFAGALHMAFDLPPPDDGEAVPALRDRLRLVGGTDASEAVA